MKMRVLTATSKGKLLTLAERIKERAESTYAVDCIPPAYAPERERLVIIVATLSDNMPSSFSIFVNGLNKDVASNVAMVVDGTADKSGKFVEKVKAAITEAGANFLDDVLYINGGLPFKFLKKAKPEEEAAVDNWISEILEAIK